MKFSARAVRSAFVVLSLLFASFTLTAQDKLLISQVYGGGGGSSASASYKTDFIEVFNAGTTGVDLTQYSVQYGPAGSSGTPSSVYSGITVLGSTTLPNNILPPGKYYLVSEGTAGTGGATLTGADQTGSINLAAAAGKVALVKGTTLLSAANSCANAAIVNRVGYGAIFPADPCAAGGAPTLATSVSTSAIRTSSCVDTSNNANDFTVGTPTPRNSSTTAAPCGGGAPVATLSITSASANPASVMAGNGTTLSVVVSPGSTSTGIAVVADLSSIGGSAAQALTLSGTANTYTYAATVGGTIAPNSYALPVTVTDQQGGSASGSISLTVQPAVVSTPISTIQANRSTYVGTTVSTTGIITVRTSSGFYMQTASSTPGSTGDEGLYVYTGSTVVAGAVVGNSINVTGTLTQYPAVTASHTPSLELTSPAVSVVSTGNALPTAIALSASSLTPAGGIYQLKPYESMLVKFPSLTATSGTDGYLTENTETSTSSGQFYTVVTGTARPFREPGIDFRDFPATTCPTLTNCTATQTSGGATRPTNLVLYDDNPERLIVESSLGGGTPLDLSTGAVLTNVTGVIDFSYSTDVPYGDPARLIALPGSITTANYTPGISVQPLALPNAGEVSIAAFNIERFFNTSAADNKYFDPVSNSVKTSLAVNVTADAYARRLKKLSVAIRNVLNAPDVISVEEVENVSVLNDIAAQIDTDATAAGQTAPHYTAYGTDSTTTYTNDIGGISIGFLVKSSTTNVVSFEQKGNTSTFQASTGTQTLNDRPSDVLHVTFNRGAGVTPYPMTLISNHLRSLSGINTSADTRLKKELQAEMLANLIQGYQASGEHVLAMGDLNAFEFSDGYTDTLGTITGNIAPANSVVQPGKAIVSPAAVDLVTLLPAAQRQTYVEFGNAQVLDHIVATADIASSTRLAIAHLNSDFPDTLLNDATSPSRTSDHDAAVAFVPVPAVVLKGTLTGNPNFPDQAYGTTFGTSQQYVVTNTGDGPITITGVTATGDFSASSNCPTAPATLAVNGTCSVNVSFTPTAVGPRTGTLTVSSNATGIGPLTLTGNGTGTTAAITFNVPNQTYGTGSPFTVTATSASAGAFTYTVVSGPATISGNTVTLTGAGSVTLQAAQAANAGYSANSKTATFTVAPGTAAITFTVPNHTYGDAPFPVTATSASAGAFTYTVVSGPATISGNTVTLTGTGTVTLQASQAATTNYVANTQTASFNVAAGTAAITFTVPNHTFGDAPFTVTATSASTGAFTYSVVSGPATISGNTVTLTGTGTVTLQASQAATTNYVANTQTASFNVAAGTAAITFTVPNHTYGDAPFPVTATSASAGAFTYTVVSGPATISGNTVTLTGAGTVVLQASQAANGNYTASTGRATFTVAKGTPVVTFARPAAIPYGTALTATQLNATASVAGTFVYTPAAGTVLGGGTQTLSVQFTPSDTTNYVVPAAATTTVVVNAATTTTAVTSSLNPSSTGVAVTFTATVTAATGTVPTGSVVFSDGATVMGTSTLNNGVATYTTSTLSVTSHTITATYQATANDASSSGTVTQVVNAAAFSVTDNGSSTFALTVTRGSSVTTQITITPTAAFSGTVTLSCANLPANVTCYFFNQTLTFSAGGGAQTSSLRLDTATTTSRLQQPATASTAPRLAFALWLPGLLLAGAGARSRKLRGTGNRLLLAALLLLGAAGLGTLTGCGGSGNNTATAAAGSSTFTVVATSGTTTQSLPITLTVQ